MAVGIFFTRIDFCQVHIYFGHLLVNKLYKLLTETGYDIEYKTIIIINKFYHYYQIKSKVL